MLESPAQNAGARRSQACRVSGRNPLATGKNVARF